MNLHQINTVCNAHPTGLKAGVQGDMFLDEIESGEVIYEKAEENMIRL